MATIDYSHLSAEERLELIAEIWQSIDADHVPLTSAQTEELRRRAASSAEEAKHARDAKDVLTDLRRRYR